MTKRITAEMKRLATLAGFINLDKMTFEQLRGTAAYDHYLATRGPVIGRTPEQIAAVAALCKVMA